MGMREIQGTPRLGEVKQGVKEVRGLGDQGLETLRRAVGWRESGESVEVSAPAAGGCKAVVDKAG